MESGDDEREHRGDVIAVNQVGYRPTEEKRAVVALDGRSFAAPTADPPASDPLDTDRPVATGFAVLDAATGARAYEGELSEPVGAPDAGRPVRHADFTDLEESGTYEVVIDGGTARSHPFRIGEDVYEDVLGDVGRLYSLKRSGVAIDDPETGLSVDPGHPQDAEASLYFEDEFHDRGDPIDVSGGWYDAGDYGKYVPPAAIAVAFHLLAYELAPDAFDAGQYDLPAGLRAEGDDGDAPIGPDETPDVLAEARFELEWLERMQRHDGAVYHKVAGERWTPWGLTPADDGMDRHVFGLSTFGTAMYAGAMAMAARVYEPLDEAFAERALENGVAAFDFLLEQPDPHFRFDDGQGAGSGPYRKDSDAGERFWAAAELLKTTGEDRYARYLEAECADQFDEPVVPPTWASARAFGQWAYRTADDEHAGERAVDPERRAALDDAFVDAAEDLLELVEADGYRIALRSEEYHWASAKVAVTNGALLLLANEVEPRPAFVEAALDQLHYVLGRSPTGYSYVTGHGSRPVRQPHDRLVGATGTLLPGMLVGGPNANGDDEVMADFVEAADPPPALAYLDAPRAYSVNEWAIDYSAPLLFVLAHATRSD